jgi:hypothetical protein
MGKNDTNYGWVWQQNLLPLLVVDFYFLNPIINDLSEATPIDDDSIFGTLT